ncbi:MAG: hypothetical protein H6Q25_1319 [Bacteroidetes bacterium]|nr:hypothetical protein [Bacteroidota bacterium]
MLNTLMNINEDWVDQRNSLWNTPYTFSGKEKDAETGYGCFGAMNKVLDFFETMDNNNNSREYCMLIYDATYPKIDIHPFVRMSYIFMMGDKVVCYMTPNGKIAGTVTFTQFRNLGAK